MMKLSSLPEIEEIIFFVDKKMLQLKEIREATNTYCDNMGLL